VRIELIDRPDALGIQVVIMHQFNHPVDLFGGLSPLSNLNVCQSTVPWRGGSTISHCVHTSNRHVRPLPGAPGSGSRSCHGVLS